MARFFDLILLPTPASWAGWWTAFVPCLIVAVGLWAADAPYAGWLVAGVVATFALISRQFAARHWLVVMRCGAGLTALALVVIVGAAFTAEASADWLNPIAGWLYPMHRSGFVPLMLTGFGLCAAGGFQAILRQDDD